eukprot:1092939-Amphidinium_carterae.1
MEQSSTQGPCPSITMCTAALCPVLVQANMQAKNSTQSAPQLGAVARAASSAVPELLSSYVKLAATDKCAGAALSRQGSCALRPKARSRAQGDQTQGVVA